MVKDFTERKCKGCGASFIPSRVGKRHKGVYCSRQCHGKENKIKKACLFCGNHFMSYRRDDKSYCSEGCRKARMTGEKSPSWKGGKIKAECRGCGLMMEFFPSEKKKFCSRGCMANFRRGKMVGKSNPNWKGGNVTSICKNCNNEFEHRRCFDAVYCSKECFNIGEFSSRSAKRWKTRFGYKGSKSGKRSDLDGLFVRSSWEANYARYLNLLISMKQIKSWTYESETFEFHKIKKGTMFYTPDFVVVTNKGDIEYHEVKGYMTQKGKTAIDRFKRYYPEKKFILIDKTSYLEIQRNFKSAITEWE